MSKKSKVRFSEILERTGFSGQKALAYLGLPLCESIQLENQSTATSIDITIYDASGSQTYTSAGGVIITIRPTYPLLSHVKVIGDQLITFRYQNTTLTQKFAFTDQISVPMPPDWPTPYFLNPKYSPLEN